MKKVGFLALSFLLLAGCGNTDTIEVKVMEVNENGETVEKIIEVTEEEAIKVAQEAGVELETITVEPKEEDTSEMNDSDSENSKDKAEENPVVDHNLKTNAVLWQTGVDPLETEE